ncbi:helix-turn-helix domain-containing protein [Gilvibacter sp.]|uniref:helix-turn-helix domain-containing protein n=1 Tax=Gilvibacter sp. TaxID=2729997 RepID=UPI003F4A5DFE
MKFFMPVFLFCAWSCFGQQVEQLTAENYSEVVQKIFDSEDFYGAIDSIDIVRLKAIVPLAYKTKDRKTLSNIYHKLAELERLTYREDNALLYLSKIDSLWGTTLDSITIEADILRANINSHSIKNEDRGKAQLEHALSQARRLGNRYLEHRIFIRLGRIFIDRFDDSEKQVDIDSARYYLESAYNYFKSNAANPKALERSLRYLSYGETKAGNHSKAGAYLQENLERLQNGEYPLGEASAFSTLGSFSLEIGQFEQAISYMMEAKARFETLGYPNLESQYLIYRDLALSYGALERYEPAYKYGFTFMELNTRMINNQNAIRVTEMDARYKNAEMQQQLAVIAARNALIEQQKKNQLTIFLALLALAIGGGLFFFLQQRDRKRTNEKLQELDAVKTNLFTNISHELRTPLTLIQGSLEQLELSAKTKPDALSIAQDNTDRLTNLVGQITDLAKLDSGQLILKVSPGNLSGLLTQQLESFQYKVRAKNLEFIADIESLTAVYFNEDMLLKIMANLINNSVKYAPSGSQIQVRLAAAEHEALFTISNLINPNAAIEVDQWFERFYTSRKEQGGMGVGLALVKELAALHKGTITAERLADRVQFVLRIPITIQDYAAHEILEFTDSFIESESLDDSSITKDAKVLLIVDDNAEIRALVAGNFKNEFQIIEANSGASGIEMATTFMPDIIISDVMMTPLDGVAMTKAIKDDSRTGHIPIVLLTAKVGAEDTVKGTEAGADAYIEKPFKSAVLKAQINQLIRTREALQKRFSTELVLKPLDVVVSNGDQRFFERVQAVLEADLTNPQFTSELFGKNMGMSRMQLYRKLKALTGMTATEFIRSQRLTLATELLTAQGISIAEVAYQVGFNDPSYFSKCFKEQFALSPKAFIEQQRAS